MYQGAPGKDIYFALSSLSHDQLLSLADVFSDIFPLNQAPSDHVGYAACLRYVYGQFEKQGSLRSKEDFRRMLHEELDWQLPRIFLSMVIDQFIQKGNYYGQSILYEMEAHRLGDEAVLRKQPSNLDAMEQTYLKSVEAAHRCNSYKQMFTPYYWASMYFIRYPVQSKAISFCRITIKEAERHCPDSRGSYVEKLVNCLKYLRSNDPKWDKWRDRWKKKCNNACVKKAFSKV